MISSASSRGLGGLAHSAAVRNIRELVRVAERIESYPDKKQQGDVRNIHRFFCAYLKLMRNPWEIAPVTESSESMRSKLADDIHTALAMYKSRAESITDFVYEVSTALTGSKDSVYVFGNVNRKNAGGYQTHA